MAGSVISEGEKIPLAFPDCAKCQALYEKWTKEYSKFLKEKGKK